MPEQNHLLHSTAQPFYAAPSLLAETNPFFIMEDDAWLPEHNSYYEYADDAIVRDLTPSIPQVPSIPKVSTVPALPDPVTDDEEDSDDLSTQAGFLYDECSLDSYIETDDGFFYSPDMDSSDTYYDRPDIAPDFHDLIGADYDEDTRYEEFNYEIATGTVSRYRCAKDAATDLVLRIGWDRDGIDILAAVFCRYGWGSTKKVLTPFLETGLRPEVLQMADQVRELWASYPAFSLYFTHHQGFSSRQGYLSWTIAIKLVCSFGNYPDMDEIEALLFELYDHWVNDLNLISEYLCFQNYLAYRTGWSQAGMYGSPWLILEPEIHIGDCPAHDYYYEEDNRSMARELLELGYDIESMDISAMRITHPRKHRFETKERG
ncbi:MAG: hypothetical protein ACR2HF_09665 [Methylococcaceae bacterium]